MSAKELLRFRTMLLAGRGEILDRIRQLDAAMRALSERESELEEEAQKNGIAGAYGRLGENGQATIELIDLALMKMVLGDYGICESCGDDISLKRLDALPWTRLCIECAREHERKRTVLPQPREAAGSGKLPEEYKGLTRDQLLGLVRDRIEREDQIDGAELKIDVRNAVLIIEGSVASELEHQILLQVLVEDLGFGEVVDLVEVKEPWEGPGYIPGSSSMGRDYDDPRLQG